MCVISLCTRAALQVDISCLVRASSVSLPDELVGLLSFSNGGEGSVALPPLMFVLDSAGEIVRSIEDEWLSANFPGFLFFGGNGGLERMALDLRSGNPPWPIVMIDPIAGPESAREVAADFATFCQVHWVEQS